MKNISRNGIQAAVVYEESYLGHKAYPSFSLGGNDPFTIEVRFAYTKSNGGILYAQENGFEIGFKNDIPYFSHPSLGRLDGVKDRKLRPNGLLMVSVTYDGSRIGMQINGIEVAKKDKKGTVNYSDTDDFLIGKYFNGYIEGVRVVKKALSDSELLKDYGCGFNEYGDTVFRTDFSTKQYKDIGPDALAIWRTGNEAHCANVVNATRLDANGAYVRHDKLTFNDGFSVCGRIYPDFSGKQKQTIYALGSSVALLSLSMEPDDDNRYFLTASAGEKKIKSSKEIEGLMWHDVVLSVNIVEKKAVLYLDGENVAEGELDPGVLTDTTAVIGAEFFTTSARYNRGFAGYIDYISEFEKAVSGKEAADFIEHEPYFYDDGIASLLLFAWGEPRDALQGKDIAEYGEGYYTMAADTCPLDAPRGTGWIVPQEPDEDYWKSLTDYQQWALTMYVELVAETVEGMLGISMAEPSGDACEEITTGGIVHRRYLGPDTRRVLEWAEGSAEADEMTPLLEGETPVKRRVTEVFREARPEGWPAVQQPGAVAGGAGVGAAATAGGGAATTGSTAGYIFGTGAGLYVIKKMTERINRTVEEEEDRRPQNPQANLQVVSCSWNDKGRAESGTVYFHWDKDFMTGPASMEWMNNGVRVEMTAVFVPSVLTSLIMRVRVRNVGDAAYNGRLRMISDNGAIAESSAFALQAGSETTVTIQHADLAAFRNDTIRITRGTYALYYASMQGDGFTFMSNVAFEYATLANKPIAPWQTGENAAYNPNNSMYIHTRLLGLFVNQANVSAKQTVAEKVVDGIITWMNTSGKLAYDNAAGAMHYTTGWNQFKRVKFLRDMTGGGVGHILNCADCANIVSTLAAMHGLSVPMVFLTGVGGFSCNQVQVITNGNPQWEVPFSQMGPLGGGRFSYHMVNRTSSGTQYNVDIGIYDACLKVDGGQYPGIDNGAGTVKISEQPQGLLGNGSENDYINVPTTTPYGAQVYRERLVRNGEIAGFLNVQYLPGRFDDNVNMIRMGDDLQMSVERFSSDNRVSDMELIGSEYGEYEWRFNFEGSDTEVLYYAEADSKGGMDDVLEKFSTTMREYVEDEKAGIEGCKVGLDCYVVKKNGRIYRLTGEKAWDVAKDIL